MKQFPSILCGRTGSNGLQGEGLTMSLPYLHPSMALCCPIKFRLFNAAYKALDGWPHTSCSCRHGTPHGPVKPWSHFQALQIQLIPVFPAFLGLVYWLGFSFCISSSEKCGLQPSRLGLPRWYQPKLTINLYLSASVPEKLLRRKPLWDTDLGHKSLTAPYCGKGHALCPRHRPDHWTCWPSTGLYFLS